MRYVFFKYLIFINIFFYFIYVTPYNKKDNEFSISLKKNVEIKSILSNLNTSLEKVPNSLYSNIDKTFKLSLQIAKQKKLHNYLIFISVFGLLAIICYRFKVTQKTANLLLEQNTIINNQKINLEKANRNKNKLLSIIAHDLINPFNAILGFTKLLDEEYDNFNEVERKKYIKIINKYATNNYKLTKTLLDWTKTQQDCIVPQKKVINCKKVIFNAIQPYLILADKKEIQVNIEIPRNTSILADNNMMLTVIGNLFVNAIKYTPKYGQIKLNLIKKKNKIIQIKIEDNGVGMTNEQLNNLFDISKISSVEGTEKEKGNGLGLIVCKELMELQKGTLQMFSKKNIGSKAILTI